MAATLAPTITALEGSVMRPVRDAFVDWPFRTHGRAIRNRSATATARRMILDLLCSRENLAYVRSRRWSIPNRGVCQSPDWGMLRLRGAAKLNKRLERLSR